MPSTYPSPSGYGGFSALDRNPWSSWCNVDPSSLFLRLRPFQNRDSGLSERFRGTELKQKKEDEGIVGLKKIWEIRDLWRDPFFPFLNPLLSSSQLWLWKMRLILHLDTKFEPLQESQQLQMATASTLRMPRGLAEWHTRRQLRALNAQRYTKIHFRFSDFLSLSCTGGWRVSSGNKRSDSFIR